VDGGEVVLPAAVVGGLSGSPAGAAVGGAVVVPHAQTHVHVQAPPVAAATIGAIAGTGGGEPAEQSHVQVQVHVHGWSGACGGACTPPTVTGAEMVTGEAWVLAAVAAVPGSSLAVLAPGGAGVPVVAMAVAVEEITCVTETCAPGLRIVIGTAMFVGATWMDCATALGPDAGGTGGAAACGAAAGAAAASAGAAAGAGAPASVAGAGIGGASPCALAAPSVGVAAGGAAGAPLGCPAEAAGPAGSSPAA